METCNKRLWAFCAVFFVLLPAASPAAAEHPNHLLPLYMTDQGVLTVNAQGATLQRLVEELREICFLDIEGLDAQGAEEIHVSSTGSVEMVVEDLLRTIGVSNDALEFRGEDIVLVKVFPFSDSVAVFDSDQPALDQPGDVIEAVLRAALTTPQPPKLRIIPPPIRS